MSRSRGGIQRIGLGGVFSGVGAPFFGVLNDTHGKKLIVCLFVCLLVCLVFFFLGGGGRVP